MFVCGENPAIPKIKLLSAHEERVVNISGDDVGLLHQVRVEHRPRFPHCSLLLLTKKVLSNAHK
jgi:hypothetical protein